MQSKLPKKLPMKLKKSANKIILLILFFAFSLRFTGISWGLPFHFHPDEWNMAAAINGLSLENKLNPNFFAYGQFPLYLSFFSAKLYNLLPWIELKSISINEAIFFLRFWSALAGVASVYLVYILSKKMVREYFPLVAAAMAAFSPGLIQSAHFGTTESLLGFFFLLLIYFSFKINEKDSLKYYFFSSIVFGLALGTKISSLLFLAPIGFLSLLKIFSSVKEKKWNQLLNQISYFLFFLIIAAVFFLISSPYFLLEFEETRRILSYETLVATGKIPVFYTRQFIKTTPALFQLKKIFPFALGPIVFLLGLAGIFYFAFQLTSWFLKKRKPEIDKGFLILFISFLVFFFYQSFLFCKWTRFMAPIFSFFSIFSAYFLEKISTKVKPLRSMLAGVVFLALIPGVLFSSIYLREDIRFKASRWIFKNIPSGSRVLSETGNVIDIPVFPQDFYARNFRLSPVSFDFYRLDEEKKVFEQLLLSLEKSDYIFVPSRRIFANHQRLTERFPLTAKYYQLLFSGKLGFVKIKEISYNPLIFDEMAEETFSVFDHPTIRIYKKEKFLNRNQYEELFKN
ncbi:hypothetical protein C4578_00590 [Candidatus Microgenomates bacterium]|jgi:hypothetical protein|nr:MAG: hypothetical protein C4578_00590 [Candidatus Microgenomates bacterium]